MKYRVLKPYSTRKVGDVIESAGIGGLSPKDSTALELGGLEEVNEKESLIDQLNRYIINDSKNKSVSELAIAFFKSRMLKKEDNITNTHYIDGFNAAIDKVNRDVFGEE